MRIFLAWVISIFTLGYLLPTGISIGRKRTNTVAIFVLNLFLGWSIIGWVIALIWAVAADDKKIPVVPIAQVPGQ